MSLPTREAFPASPVTTITHYAGEDRVRIGAGAVWSAGEYAPYDLHLQYPDGQDVWFPLSELAEVAPGMWTGRVASSESVGPAITIRPTVEADAVGVFEPSIPLPLAVISELLSGGALTMPKLWAMSDDDGFVATMMLDSGAGLYVRYSGGWHRIIDADAVDGLTVTEVDDASLDMYDQFDRAGQMVALSAMYSGGQPVMAEMLTEGSPATPVPPAPSETREVPLLSSAADLDSAIDAAIGDEGLQWYVERRALALGLEAEFPWK